MRRRCIVSRQNFGDGGGCDDGRVCSRTVTSRGECVSFVIASAAVKINDGKHGTKREQLNVAQLCMCMNVCVRIIVR